MVQRQTLLLFFLWCGIFWNRAGYSVIAPFFPTVAHQKGLSTGQFSFVFGAFAFSELIFSSFIGKYMSGINVKFLVTSGMLLTGCSNALFGVMEYSPGGTVFLVLCSLIRVLEGAGYIIYFTTVITILVNLFPTHPGFYMGCTNMVATCGIFLGIPIGSIFYTVFGYLATFVAIGGVILLTDIMLFIVMNNNSEPDICQEVNSSLTFKEYFCILTSIKGSLLAPISTLGFGGFTYTLINLSDHIQQFELNPVATSGIYISISIAYGISSLLGGMIADKIEFKLSLQGIGFLIGSVGYMLSGPALFVPFEKTVALITVGLFLVGIGNGLGQASAFSSAMTAAREHNFSEGFRTYSLVSSIFAFFMTCGEILGSLISGFFGDKLSFSLATTIIIGLYIPVVIAALLLQTHELVSSKSNLLKKCLNKDSNSSTESSRLYDIKNSSKNELK